MKLHLILKPFLILSLFFSIFWIFSTFLTPVFAQDIREPEFQDSYWTTNNIGATTSSILNSNNQIKQDANPGEGTATLAVVLVNKANSELTGVQGQLELPSGIVSNSLKLLSNNTTAFNSSLSYSSYNSKVSPGEFFTLFFDVIITDDIDIGFHNSKLHLSYSKVLERGKLQTVLDVPFKIPGNILLDVLIKNEDYKLIPGIQNNLTLSLVNFGSVNATNVVLEINEVSSNSLGMNQTSDRNKFNDIPLMNIGKKIYDVGDIGSYNRNVDVDLLLYPDRSFADSIQNLNMALSYNDVYGNDQRISKSIGLIILPESPNSGVFASIFQDDDIQKLKQYFSITAGKIEPIKISVTNNNTYSISDVKVTLSTNSKSSNLLDNSYWIIDNIIPNNSHYMNTLFFAPEESIHNTILFNVDLDYIENDQRKSESFEFGSYIKGDISITVNDLSINDIGGVPNIVGTILNEGNTKAYFSTLTVTNKSLLTFLNLLPPSQYLGDLTENSPLPFNIPVSLNQSTANGNYDLELQISYQDDLRNLYTIFLNKTLKLNSNIFNIVSDNNSRNTTESSNMNLFYNFQFLIILILSIVILILILLFIKKRKKNQKFVSSIKKYKDINQFINDNKTNKDKSQDDT